MTDPIYQNNMDVLNTYSGSVLTDKVLLDVARVRIAHLIVALLEYQDTNPSAANVINELSILAPVDREGGESFADILGLSDYTTLGGGLFTVFPNGQGLLTSDMVTFADGSSHQLLGALRTLDPEQLSALLAQIPDDILVFIREELGNANTYYSIGDYISGTSAILEAVGGEKNIPVAQILTPEILITTSSESFPDFLNDDIPPATLAQNSYSGVEFQFIASALGDLNIELDPANSAHFSSVQATEARLLELYNQEPVNIPQLVAETGYYVIHTNSDFARQLNDTFRINITTVLTHIYSGPDSWNNLLEMGWNTGNTAGFLALLANSNLPVVPTGFEDWLATNIPEAEALGNQLIPLTGIQTPSDQVPIAYDAATLAALEENYQALIVYQRLLATPDFAAFSEDVARYIDSEDNNYQESMLALIQALPDSDGDGIPDVIRPYIDSMLENRRNPDGNVAYSSQTHADVTNAIMALSDVPVTLEDGSVITVNGSSYDQAIASAILGVADIYARGDSQDLVELLMIDFMGGGTPTGGMTANIESQVAFMRYRLIASSLVSALIETGNSAAFDDINQASLYSLIMDKLYSPNPSIGISSVLGSLSLDDAQRAAVEEVFIRNLSSVLYTTDEQGIPYFSLDQIRGIEAEIVAEEGAAAAINPPAFARAGIVR
jgi:hypothetical protein